MESVCAVLGLRREQVSGTLFPPEICAREVRVGSGLVGEVRLRWHVAALLSPAQPFLELCVREAALDLDEDTCDEGEGDSPAPRGGRGGGAERGGGDTTAVPRSEGGTGARQRADAAAAAALDPVAATPVAQAVRAWVWAVAVRLVAWLVLLALRDARVALWRCAVRVRGASLSCEEATLDAHELPAPPGLVRKDENSFFKEKERPRRFSSLLSRVFFYRSLALSTRLR